MRTKIAASFLAMAGASFLGSCSGPGLAGASGKPAPIQYYYVDVFADYDVQLRIAPDGAASITERRGIGAGDIRQASTQLSPDQLSGVWKDFGGWASLKTAYALDFNPQVHITYGDHEVVTSNIDKAPPEFRKAGVDLRDIAAILIKKMDAQSTATRPGAATQINPRTGNAF